MGTMFRIRLKIKAVEYKGGKCEVCSYNKSIKSLHFHHIDPTKKDFGISRASKSWDKIKPELDKCMLVCSNCHGEIHEEIDKQNVLEKSKIDNKPIRRIKVWRIKTKQRIVDSFNGACGICRYSKSNNSLVLHHLNPSEKDLTLGQIRATPISWERIVEELRKCIMVCHNCHHEIHNDNLVVPEDITRFNEEYANYKEQEKKITKENNIDCCSICNLEKLKSKKYCSLKCSSKSRERIDWGTIDLLEEFKNKSKSQIAKELNVSVAVVRKRLKRLFTHNSIVEYQAVNLGVLGAGPSE